MTAAAYTASVWPIAGLLFALLVFFALALCTANKSPAPRRLVSVARSGVLRSQTVGSSPSVRALAPQPPPRIEGGLRAVGTSTPVSTGSVSGTAPRARQPHGSTYTWPAARGPK